jgi:hypothetical protein
MGGAPEIRFRDHMTIREINKFTRNRKKLCVGRAER